MRETRAARLADDVMRRRPPYDDDASAHQEGRTRVGSTSAPPRRSPADKHDARRNQLAESALQTLGEVGYARTSLREVAQNSEFSHGVVHYYFEDKLELILYSRALLQGACVTRYDGVVADSTTAEGLLDAFAAKLAETIRDEAPMHRLWYDLRTQACSRSRCARPSGHRQDP